MFPSLGWQKSLRIVGTLARTGLVVVACLSMSFIVVPIGGAAAGGIFEAIFGMLGGRPPPPPRGPLGYGDPSADPLDPSGPARPAGEPGRGVAYCVRLCDGRYFPLANAGRESRSGTCNALCPASETRIFWGSNDGPSVANDGTDYDALPNAYLYRERLLPDCTCNGKTSYGLASINSTADPTLRQGDIIATSEGMKVFAGAPRGARGMAGFIPVQRYSPLSPETRRKLATMRVAPGDGL
jgi:hypothetical protein